MLTTGFSFYGVMLTRSTRESVTTKENNSPVTDHAVSRLCHRLAGWDREMTKTAQNQNGPRRGPKWPRRKQKWPKRPKSKMVYGDVKNVIINNFSLQILAVLGCAKTIFLRNLKFCSFHKFLRILKFHFTKSHSMHIIHIMNTRSKKHFWFNCGPFWSGPFYS